MLGFGLHLRADTGTEGLASFLHPLTPHFQLLPQTHRHQPDFRFSSKSGLMHPLGLRSYFKQIIRDI